MTFIDMLREIKYVPLGEKRAIKMPLMAAEISSAVTEVGYQEAEVVDLVVKLGAHSSLRYPNESNERRAEMIHETRKMIADLVYRDVTHGLLALQADVYRVDDHELRYSMETSISDIMAKIEIA